MVNPCCCCSVAAGARILAVVSLVIAVILVGTSSWILKETYEERESDSYKAAKTAAGAANTIGNWLGVEGKINVEKRNNILLACSAVGVAVGGLQLLTSFFLLVGAAGKSRSPSGVFSFVNSVGFFAIVGSIVCLFYNEIFDIEKIDKLPENQQYWFGAMIADAVFLLYANCAACCFVRN